MKGQINELRQIMEATKKKSTEPDCTNGKWVELGEVSTRLEQSTYTL